MPDEFDEAEIFPGGALFPKDGGGVEAEKVEAVVFAVVVFLLGEEFLYQPEKWSLTKRFSSKCRWARSREICSRVLEVRPMRATTSPALTGVPYSRPGRISLRCA